VPSIPYYSSLPRGGNISITHSFRIKVSIGFHIWHTTSSLSKNIELLDELIDRHTTPVDGLLEKESISSATTSDENKFHQGPIRLQLGLKAFPLI